MQKRWYGSNHRVHFSGFTTEQVDSYGCLGFKVSAIVLAAATVAGGHFVFLATYLLSFIIFLKFSAWLPMLLVFLFIYWKWRI